MRWRETFYMETFYMVQTVNKKAETEEYIPFVISADPFYSESNMEHLRRGIAALNAGRGVMHETIEPYDE